MTRLSDLGTWIQFPAEAEFFFPSQKHSDKLWSAISPLANGARMCWFFCLQHSGWGSKTITHLRLVRGSADTELRYIRMEW